MASPSIGFIGNPDTTPFWEAPRYIPFLFLSSQYVQPLIELGLFRSTDIVEYDNYCANCYGIRADFETVTRILAALDVVASLFQPSEDDGSVLELNLSLASRSYPFVIYQKDFFIKLRQSLNDGLAEFCLNRAIQEDRATLVPGRAVPVAIHHVGQGSLSEQLPRYFYEMNKVFRPIGIRFYSAVIRELSPEVIAVLPQDTSLSDYQDALVPGALNVVIGASLDFRWDGRANWGKGFVVKDGMSTHTWIHEMGHVFGLIHTHAYQYAYDKTRPGINDPKIEVAICSESQGQPSAWLASETSCPDPDPTNYMSYHGGQDHFTDGQYASMRCFFDRRISKDLQDLPKIEFSWWDRPGTDLFLSFLRNL